MLLDDIQSVIAEETDPTTKSTEIEIEITESQETLPAEMPNTLFDLGEISGETSMLSSLSVATVSSVRWSSLLYAGQNENTGMTQEKTVINLADCE